MSVHLTESQNFSLGVIAALIEGFLLQPTVYWKNARAQNLPFSLNPSLLYRGTGASIINEMQMLGLHFGITGFFKKILSIYYKDENSISFCSAWLGGATSALFVSPVELVMIQQQRYGKSMIQTIMNIFSTKGGKGLFRGVIPAIARDSLFVAGFLGITPMLQQYLMTQFNQSSVQAGFWASVIGGTFAAVPSHPLDLVKTCMQGDIEQKTYTTMTKSMRILWLDGGVKRIFKGCFWSSFNIMATVYIANECRLVLPQYLYNCEY